MNYMVGNDMPTSKNHKDLENFAVEYLIERGFQPKEIQKDYTLDIGKHHYYIDVVGIKKDGSLSIAVECGNCPIEKVIRLQPFFDEVKILPFDILESIKGLDKNVEIKRLKREKKDLQNKLEIVKRQKEKKEKDKRFLLAILIHYNVIPEHWINRYQIRETLNTVTYALDFSKRYGEVEARLRLEQLVRKMEKGGKE